MKRSHHNHDGGSHKKHKQDNLRNSSSRHGDKSSPVRAKQHGRDEDCAPDNNAQQRHNHGSTSSNNGEGSKPTISHQEAMKQLPPPTSKSGPVPSYVPFTVPTGLPALPSIKPGPFSAAPFKHKSSLSAYDRTTSTSDLSYERLEILGDAYIELIASRLLFERFFLLPAGGQSQLRELLVKNETLAEYSRAYNLDARLETGSPEARAKMIEESKSKGNKGWNKILGDVFEAYVAAVILSDVEDGFAVAETWLTALWAPKLLSASQKYTHTSEPLTHSSSTDPRTTYSPTAKQTLQTLLLARDVQLLYEPFRAPLELKGDLLGQNRHFIALYLTGYGYERRLLGKGEGKNKVEAGNWAAVEAMFGEGREVVEECADILRREREERRRRLEGEKKAEG